MFEKFNLKKAILSGLAYYIPTFILGMLAMNFISKSIGGMIWWTSSIIFMIISMKYIYSESSAFNMAIIFLATTFIIEIPMLVYGMNYGWSLYLMWTVWVQYGLLIVTPFVAKKFLK